MMVGTRKHCRRCLLPRSVHPLGCLRLAKESQVSREECESWLSCSLEEIDLWKSWYMELKKCGGGGDGFFELGEPSKKSVHFATTMTEVEEEYGCPPPNSVIFTQAEEEGCRQSM